MNKLSHIGILMDGNGRWAESKGFKRYFGHEKGVRTFEKVLKWCIELDIPYLSVYAFSTENWNRSDEEIDHIFNLMKIYLRRKRNELINRGVCIKVIGDTTRLDKDIIELIQDITVKTATNRIITVQLAVNYGGRNEIIRAVKKLSYDVNKGVILNNHISEKVFEEYLDTSGIPDVDLLIRTGRVKRISNFMPWQTIYSELFFSDLLWPEFSLDELKRAINYYMMTERRYGS